MAKTQPPGVAEVAGTSFVTNVMPDVFDARDLEYRPRLQPLPAVKDARPQKHLILTQEGSSCTGHAVASMINTVLASTPDPIQVSPYMLYHMARRYDEFEGNEDQGSSLRGALKGWFYHGVLPAQDWPSLDEDIDIEWDARLSYKALRHPLGAFYRVNAFRLDDMQSAVNELDAIVASALIHTGWLEPRRVQRQDGSSYYRIERPQRIQQLGGHAFAIVGYNDVGFLVQNSWGERWGGGGCATLPYEDWLASAFDAWVARPGVPLAVNPHQATEFVPTTTGGLAQGPGPDLETLGEHVINLGNDGRLSAKGRFVSTPAQVHHVFQRMRALHDAWQNEIGESPAPRRVVLYAHGGLVDERSGLAIAQSQLHWWLNNGVYPITFVWQTGPTETLVNHLVETVRDKLPFGALGFDLVEQADRLVEKLSRLHLSWMWAEMKENAAAASASLPSAVSWSEDGPVAGRAMADMPGASLVVDRLRAYAETVEEDVEVHLVGHSAGSIFTAHLLTRLVEAGVRVASISWLAPAIRVDEFNDLVLPHLRAKVVGRFTSFGLSDAMELNDMVGTSKLTVYQKSILYLVSRALEKDHSAQRPEIPLLGMQRHAMTTVAKTLEGLPAELIWSPCESPSINRCSAHSHGGMDTDVSTMTSVLLRILGRTEPRPENTFRAYSAPGPRPSGAAAAPAAVTDAETVDVAPAGETPVTRAGEPQSIDDSAG